ARVRGSATQPGDGAAVSGKHLRPRHLDPFTGRCLALRGLLRHPARWSFPTLPGGLVAGRRLLSRAICIMRVLLADDHALFRDGLRSLLEARGVEVIGEARNGRDAVDETRRLRPDVVLMDLHMPELD